MRGRYSAEHFDRKLHLNILAIAELKHQLAAQNEEIEKLLKDQYTSAIKNNNAQIASLRAQQLAANARFIGAPGSGSTCGGGYPSKWCNAEQDSTLDNWGMLNRQCVSYTAFKVAASGRYMPAWGYRSPPVGNANQWDDNARAEGIPVDTNPRAGDVAISNTGEFGHAMYVESVNSNGTINISQYNAGLMDATQLAIIFRSAASSLSTFNRAKSIRVRVVRRV